MYNRRDNASQKSTLFSLSFLDVSFFMDPVYLLFGLSVSCILTRIVDSQGFGCISRSHRSYHLTYHDPIDCIRGLVLLILCE